MGESRLELVGAHLRVADGAHRAAPTSSDERNGDTLPGSPTADVIADRHDRSRQFVAGDMGQDDVSVVTLPLVPVTAANSGRLDGHDDT